MGIDFWDCYHRLINNQLTQRECLHFELVGRMVEALANERGTTILPVDLPKDRETFLVAGMTHLALVQDQKA